MPISLAGAVTRPQAGKPTLLDAAMLRLTTGRDVSVGLQCWSI